MQTGSVKFNLTFGFYFSSSFVNEQAIIEIREKLLQTKNRKSEALVLTIMKKPR